MPKTAWCLATPSDYWNPAGGAGVPNDVPALMCKAIRRLALDVLREQRRSVNRERRFSQQLNRNVLAARRRRGRGDARSPS